MRDKGTGSVTKHGKKWQARVSITVNGKRYQKSKIFKSKSEANEALAEMTAMLQRDANSITLDSYFWHVFLPDRKQRVSNATIKMYESWYKRAISPKFGSCTLNNFPVQMVQKWLNGMTNQSARHAMATLKAILNDAYYNRYVESPILRRPVSYPKDTKKPIVWSASEVMTAFERLQGFNLEPIFLIMVGGGLRKEEAVALRWSDLTFQDGFCFVRVTKAKTIEDGLKQPKTRFSERVVVIGEPFATRLGKIASDGDVCKIALTSINRSWRGLFHEPGKKMPGSYKGVLSDLPYISINRLRATHETLIQSVGVSDSINARIHGHAQASGVDYTHYMEPNTSVSEESAQALSETLKQH